ncbi:hypothetical protein D9M71_813970 [compost metagenome]
MLNGPVPTGWVPKTEIDRPPLSWSSTSAVPAASAAGDAMPNAGSVRACRNAVSG